MIPKNPTCFKMELENESHLWHYRFGHLSYNALRILSSKQMVNGFPFITTPKDLCTYCIVGKQHRSSMPKKFLCRASIKLQLVHTYICRPIKPTSNNNKRTQGIGRQLTTTCTPQHNGVAERKNRTIMDMVWSMLVEKQVP